MSNPVEYKSLRAEGGLRVVEATRHGSRSFSIALACPVPWLEAPDLPAGFPHLAEHLCFSGPNSALAERLSRSGVHLNGMTTYDSVVITGMGHVDHLDETLAFFRRVLSGFDVAAADVARELGILKNEASLSPQSAFDRTLQSFYADLVGDRQFAQRVMQDTKSVEDIDPASIREHWSALFAPSRATLVVVHPSAAAFSIGASHDPLGDYVNQEHSAENEAARPIPLKVVWANAPFCGLRVVFDIPKSDVEHGLALTLIEDLLGAGSHGRVFQRLRQRAGMGYMVGSGLHTLRSHCFLDSFAVVPRSHAVAALTELLGAVEDVREMLTQRDRVIEARSRRLRLLDMLEDNVNDLCMYLAYAAMNAPHAELRTPEAERAALGVAPCENLGSIGRECLDPVRRSILVAGPIGMIKKWRLRGVVRRHIAESV